MSKRKVLHDVVRRTFNVCVTVSHKCTPVSERWRDMCPESVETVTVTDVRTGQVGYTLVIPESFLPFITEHKDLEGIHSAILEHIERELREGNTDKNLIIEVR